MPRQLLPLALVVLSVTRGVVTGNDCQPITWEDPPEARDVSVYAANTTVPVVAVPTDAVPQKSLKAGDINCRAWARTNDDPNYYSCKDLAERWSISTNWFFQINPTILPDCSNIRPNTRYCVHACKSLICALPTPTLGILVAPVITPRERKQISSHSDPPTAAVVQNTKTPPAQAPLPRAAMPRRGHAGTRCMLA